MDMVQKKKRGDLPSVREHGSVCGVLGEFGHLHQEPVADSGNVGKS